MNQQLKQIYENDITDRNNAIPDDLLNENDRERILLVQQILDETPNLQAQDYHHAAFIFQHGETLDHYKEAHKLAMKAVELGDETARWLAAASLDRSLLMDGKPQKYGTQFIKLSEESDWELALPIDPSVTDEERAIWNVPPLKVALEVYKRKYNL